MRKETETAVKNRINIRKPALWILFSIAGFMMLFLVFYLVLSIQSVNKWVNDNNNAYSPEGVRNNDSLMIHSSGYVEVQKRIAFTKSRLKMAAGDSIGLSLNLADSMLSIEISGVTVNAVKIPEMKMSRSLTGLNPATLVNMFSNPVQVVQSESTTAKSPIIEKQAPTDTTGATIQLNIPDTSLNEPVFFELILENGIKLLVLQQENFTKSDKRSRSAYLLRRSMLNTYSKLKSVFKLQIPPYSPEILIMIPGSDARAIYRAIPEKGHVSIML